MFLGLRSKKTKNILGQLARVTPPSSDTNVFLSELNALINQIGMAKFVCEVRRQKVWPQVYDNLRILSERSDGELFREFNKISNDREKVWMVDYSSMIWKVFSILEELNERVMVFKGGALLGLYPDSAPRWMFDVDILLPNVRTSWETLNKLHDYGYAFDKRVNVVLQRTQDMKGGTQKRLIDGGAVLVPRDKVKGLELDVKLGWFSMSLSCDVFGRSKPFEGKWKHLSYPSPDDSLLIIIAHGIIHGSLWLRDINDIWLLLQKYGHEIDKEYILYHAKRSCISSCLGHALGMVKNIYGCHEILSEWTKALSYSSILRFRTRIYFGLSNRDALPKLNDVLRLSTSLWFLIPLSTDAETRKLLYFRLQAIQYSLFPLIGKITHRIRKSLDIHRRVGSRGESILLTLTPIVLTDGRQVWQPDNTSPIEISENLKSSQYRVTYMEDFNLTIIWENKFALAITPYFIFITSPPQEGVSQKNKMSQTAISLLSMLVKSKTLKLRSVRQ
jgi:hypothetical protein